MTSKRKDPVSLKIPALRGKDAETNSMIIRLLALEGPQTIYDINRLLGRKREQYPTILRAVRRLERRYVADIRTVKMRKRKEETQIFGLTRRGLIASFANIDVCNNAIAVIEKLDYLEFPIPKDVILAIVKELWRDEDIGEVMKVLFEAFISVIPTDLDSVDTATLVGCLLPAIVKSDPVISGKMKQRDLSVIGRYPEVVKWFEGLTDKQISTLEGSLRRMYAFKKELLKLRSRGKGDAQS